ncbi:MAG: MaoC domain protein dehydratase [Pseudonocardiales bacterium]|nr:MaoC domain protein dehydratase [Jatrophihabitantaceae bacterium]MCW2602155.1 MaoC domain protein dehydratase [Pseudonocardiales bacterium]
MANNVYFEDVEIGQEIPAFERKTDTMHWNRYAAINEEFVYVHMDDDAGRAAGQGQAFGMGNLRWAYVLNALRGWIGDEAEVRELSMQFRAINHKNDVLTTQGIVTEKTQENGENLVHLDINVVNQKGDKTAPGHAVVVLPSRG